MVYFQASSYDQIIGESVKQTVQHNYQTNNTAAMQTFDLVQEGVSMSTLTYLCSIILHATTSLVQCFEICAPNPKVSLQFFSLNAVARMGRDRGTRLCTTSMTSKARSSASRRPPPPTPCRAPAAPTPRLRTAAPVSGSPGRSRRPTRRSCTRPAAQRSWCSYSKTTSSTSSVSAAGFSSQVTVGYLANQLTPICRNTRHALLSLPLLRSQEDR